MGTMSYFFLSFQVIGLGLYLSLCTFLYFLVISICFVYTYHSFNAFFPLYILYY